MLVKLAIILVLCQAISISFGAVIRRDAGCQPIYMPCEKNEDCCPGNLACFNISSGSDGSEVDKSCMPLSDPGGAPLSQIGNAMVPPVDPGCGLIAEPCTETLDCCAPFICDSSYKCVEEQYSMYGSYGGYGGYAGVPGNPGK